MGIPTYFGGIIDPDRYDRRSEYVTLTCQSCGSTSEQLRFSCSPSREDAISAFGWVADSDGLPICQECGAGVSNVI